MATRLLLPRAQRVQLDGRPSNGARLYTYVTGTSTPKATFSDSALTVPNTNPIVADAAGAFGDIFPEGGAYRLVLEDGAGNVIFTADDVDGADGGSGGESAASARLRNRIINGSMQVSQEHGTSNVDVTTGNDYVLDQWFASLSAAPGGTLRLAQVASATPAGSPNRLRATVQVADGTIAAGDHYAIAQRIEGLRIPDARFGTASARQILLRFGVLSSVAGTFGLSLRNSALDRTYIATYTVAPGEINTDLIREIIIPGDTAGTWLTNTGIGLDISWALAAGTTYQGAVGWQAGGFLSASSQTNFMGTAGATFELFDVGVYVDAAASGAFPAYEIPDFADELARSMRYWQRLVSSLQIAVPGATGPMTLSQGYQFPVEMRVAPTVVMTATVAARTNVNASFPVASEVKADSMNVSILGAAAGDTADRGRVWHLSARL